MVRRRVSSGAKRASLGAVFICPCGAMTRDKHIDDHLKGHRHKARMDALKASKKR